MLKPAHPKSLVWAQLYLVTAAICSRFDFDLHETTYEDIQFAGDAFVPKMKRNCGVRVIAKDTGDLGL